MPSFFCHFILFALSTLLGASGAPIHRQVGVTAVDATTTDSFTPFSFYASTGYCQASDTLTWACGHDCDANPNFRPTTSGGDGANTQFFFVGYDPDMDTVVVSHQGTDPEKITPLLEDLDFVLEPLDPDLFPDVSSDVQVHSGFKKAHSDSASAVLDAVQNTINSTGTSSVAVVGHSLGAAIALIDTLFLSMNLDPNIRIRHIGYGLPRTGNQAFADLVDSTLSSVHINNQKDPIPILPGIDLGFHSSSGEIHIEADGTWVSCPGQDSTDAQCTVGLVPTILEGSLVNHDGPYHGVIMGSGCTSRS